MYEHEGTITLDDRCGRQLLQLTVIIMQTSSLQD